MEIKCSIKEYLGEYANRIFRIPSYQRGYKWSVRYDGQASPLKILCDDIKKAMLAGRDEYFIQGITGSENKEYIDLIDGQQRTTSLFLILDQLLNEAERKRLLATPAGKFKLQYEVRTSSYEYLCGKNMDEEKQNTQDIYYFKEAERQIKNFLGSIDADDFKEYLLSHVIIFFISIPPEQAENVFSMLNGARAFMKTDELIKAEFLCKASTVTESNYKSKNLVQLFEQMQMQSGLDWEANALRSMLARQWDKWLYWWNRPDVKAFFHADDNPMGLLLNFFCYDKISYSNSEDRVVAVFKAFQNQFIADSKTAKNNFEALRKLQKSFEDIYNDCTTYNNLGLILEVSGRRNDNAIRFFLEHQKDKEKLIKYKLLFLIGMSHDDICCYLDGSDLNKIQETAVAITEKFYNMCGLLEHPDIYEADDKKEIAFRQLFLLNVAASSDRGAKFDFFLVKENRMLKSVYRNRSLEHIWPKSKADELPESTPIHGLGNLLFLLKNDNSKFNDSEPEEKKCIYFNLQEPLSSRILLHTMSVFASGYWSAENAPELIENNKRRVIELIKKEYKECLNLN